MKSGIGILFVLFFFYFGKESTTSYLCNVFAKNENRLIENSLIGSNLNIDSTNNFTHIPLEYEQVKVDKTTCEVACINLPVGYPFYKGMPQTMLDMDDLMNSRSGRASWFGDLSTAMRYIHKSKNWGILIKNKNPWDLHAYKSVRPLKLFLLGDKNNIELLFSFAKKDIAKIEKEILGLELKISDNKKLYSAYQKTYLNRLIESKKAEKNSLEEDLLSFRIATGFNMSWEEQLEYLKSRCIDGEERVEARNHSKSVVVEKDNDSESEYYQLNRVSFDAVLDTAILRILNRYLNVDGYYNVKSHSLWHNNRIFREEIALYQTRGALKRNYEDSYDWTNKEDSKEYQEAFELYSNS